MQDSPAGSPAGSIHLLGHRLLGLLVVIYFGPNLLILAVGAYDLVTRRRLHPAYVIGVAWVLANQMTALILFAGSVLAGVLQANYRALAPGDSVGPAV